MDQGAALADGENVPVHNRGHAGAAELDADAEMAPGRYRFGRGAMIGIRRWFGPAPGWGVGLYA